MIPDRIIAVDTLQSRVPRVKRTECKGLSENAAETVDTVRQYVPILSKEECRILLKNAVVVRVPQCPSTENGYIWTHYRQPLTRPPGIGGYDRKKVPPRVLEILLITSSCFSITPAKSFVWADGISGVDRHDINDAVYTLCYPRTFENSIDRLKTLIENIRVAAHPSDEDILIRHSYGVPSLLPTEKTQRDILKQTVSDVTSPNVRHCTTQFVENAAAECYRAQVAMPCPTLLLQTLIPGTTWEWMTLDEVGKASFLPSSEETEGVGRLWMRANSGSLDTFMADGNHVNLRTRLRLFDAYKECTYEQPEKDEGDRVATPRRASSSGRRPYFEEEKGSALGNTHLFSLSEESGDNPFRYNKMKKEFIRSHGCGWMLGKRLFVVSAGRLYFDAASLEQMEGRINGKPTTLICYLVYVLLLRTARSIEAIHRVRSIVEEVESFSRMRFSIHPRLSGKGMREAKVMRGLDVTRMNVSTRTVLELIQGADRKRSNTLIESNAVMASAPPCIADAVFRMELKNDRRYQVAGAIAVVAATRGIPIEVFTAGLLDGMRSDGPNTHRIDTFRTALQAAEKRPEDRRPCITRQLPSSTAHLGCPFAGAGGPITCLAQRSLPVEENGCIDTETVTISEIWLKTDTIDTNQRNTPSKKQKGVDDDDMCC